MTDIDTDYQGRLRAFEGRELTALTAGPDLVNLPMIRHWAHAMGDTNPIYLDDEAAKATGRSGIVAPPAMVQVWNMWTYAEWAAGNPEPPVMGELFDVLHERDFTSIVATNCEQEYFRELTLGEQVQASECIETLSDEKKTALGSGHFITMLMEFRDGDQELVATQRWRLFKFRPAVAAPMATPDPVASDEAEQPLRPRPALNLDNAFWFEAAKDHTLLIQRCISCGELRHPPGPCCPHCQSFEHDSVEASGRGEIYSYVVAHSPQIPGFDYPHTVVLVQLEEGVRLIANVKDIDPEDLVVGMPVVIDWVDHDPGLSLPAFRPARKETV